jgi:hypothetical protein
LSRHGPAQRARGGGRESTDTGLTVDYRPDFCGEFLDCEGVSYCGAYWGNGFHEDGVNSAIEVSDALQSKVERPRRVLA